MLAEMDMSLVGPGVVGILVLLILKEVFLFVSKMKRNGKPDRIHVALTALTTRLDLDKDAHEAICQALKAQSEVLITAVQQISDLHVWHSPDQSGKQAWKWDFGEAIKELQKSIDRLTEKVST